MVESYKTNAGCGEAKRADKEVATGCDQF